MGHCGTCFTIKILRKPETSMNSIDNSSGLQVRKGRHWGLKWELQLQVWVGAVRA